MTSMLTKINLLRIKAREAFLLIDYRRSRFAMESRSTANAKANHICPVGSPALWKTLIFFKLQSYYQDVHNNFSLDSH